jgi:hypothetical protein
MARVSSEYNLAVKHPALAGQWHPTKNAHFTPHSVTTFFIKRIPRLCPKDHGWQDIALNHAQSARGSPHCSGQRPRKENCLETLALHLAKQWHPNRNHALTLKDVPAGRDTRVPRICGKRQEREARTKMRYLGSGCPLECGERAE